jgi:hypothetical protein
MKPSREEQERWERIVHRTLRELPPRRAPRSLEQRVLAEIERRVALPWWQKSFAHWPIAAQSGFVLVCVVLVALALTGRGWIMAGLVPVEFAGAFAQPLSWMENALVVVRAVTGFFGIMLRNIPPIWLYGGILLFGSMYAALFGLGAAAFKALRIRPVPSEPSTA